MPPVLLQGTTTLICFIFQVYDYVKSYLGDSRETREFAREFIERRKKQKDKTPVSVSSFPQVSEKASMERRKQKGSGPKQLYSNRDDVVFIA